MTDPLHADNQTSIRRQHPNRTLIRDALTDARAGMIRLEAHDYKAAAVLLRMALDQLQEAGVLHPG